MKLLDQKAMSINSLTSGFNPPGFQPNPQPTDFQSVVVEKYAAELYIDPSAVAAAISEEFHDNDAKNPISEFIKNPRLNRTALNIRRANHHTTILPHLRHSTSKHNAKQRWSKRFYPTKEKSTNNPAITMA